MIRRTQRSTRTDNRVPDTTLFRSAREEPTVSTPVAWGEVEACAAGNLELRFTSDDVLERVGQMGDLFEPVVTVEQELPAIGHRSEEHTSELQSLMRISYAVFCLKKTNTPDTYKTEHSTKYQS